MTEYLTDDDRIGDGPSPLLECYMA